MRVNHRETDLENHDRGLDYDLPRLLQRARQLLVANRWRTEQSTTGNLRSAGRAYVFERPGQPCRRCGTRIRTEEFGPVTQERRSYWCPRCQPAPGTARPAG